jgi:putative sterol carrier protein
MEQHPIPQQISSYEFKLVGEMTLKQFLKAAVGIILAVLINSTKLIVIVKWPLMLLCGGAGLLLAFVPFEDRPLETWVLAFLKSIYSPTIYTYKKRANKNWLDLEAITRATPKDEAETEEPEDIVIKTKDKSRVFEFIQSLPSVKREGVQTSEELIKTPASENLLKTGTKEEVVTATEEVKAKEKVNDWRDQKSNLNLKTEKLEATGTAVFGAIPMPDIPDVPNVVVGMATDSTGKIVDGAIVEIQDEHGNPSRVLKTNSLGQFKISTPMSNGRYLIICEKEGYKFDRVNIDLKGEIVKPIKIIATN